MKSRSNLVQFAIADTSDSIQLQTGDESLHQPNNTEREGIHMKTVLTSLILFSIYSVNAIAQDTSRLGLLEGAKARLSIGEGRILDVEFSPGGTRLAVASSSGVWLFDLDTGAVVSLMRNENSSRAFDVAYSPDGRTIAAAVDDSICLWDAETRVEKRVLSPKFHWASRVAFSPDGRTIAGSGGETVHLWDVETGQRKYTVGGVELAYAASIAFSPDSRTLASGHASPLATHSVSDGKIYLWDAETEKLKASRSRSVSLPTSLTFSPDGRTLAVGHLDGAPGLGSWGWVTLRDAKTLNSNTYWAHVRVVWGISVVSRVSHSARMGMCLPLGGRPTLTLQAARSGAALGCEDRGALTHA